MSEVSAGLRQTVEEASVWLGQIAAEGGRRPRPDTWAAREILGHLIDSASNNHQRFVRAQLESELVDPGYDQERWVKVQGYADADWRELLDLWRLYNGRLAAIIERIPPEKLPTPCRVGAKSVTLGFLAEDYLRHLRHHLGQLDTFRA
jgi:hypothetical protein